MPGRSFGPRRCPRLPSLVPPEPRDKNESKARTELIVIAAVHMRNGMRDTLEDYMHGSMYRLTMMLNTLFCLAVAMIGAGSVLKIVFWG